MISFPNITKSLRDKKFISETSKNKFSDVLKNGLKESTNVVKPKVSTLQSNEAFLEKSSFLFTKNL